MKTRGDNVALAIALSLLAIVLFDLMGLIIKLLSVRYGAAELSAYRNLFGLVPAAIALWSSRRWRERGRVIRMRQWKLACLRGVFTTFAQFCFYLSLGKLAFATATTIAYSNALFMTALAVPLLAERVGLTRWAAVLVGFAGVLMIVRPGADTFTADALLPLAAAFLYALAGVLSRKFDLEVPTPLINIYASVTSLAGATALALAVGGFSALHSGADMLWITAMGFFGGSAVLTLVVSFRMTEQSNLAPFTYFGIPIAFVLGWVFFGEFPVQDLFPGAFVIAFAGLLIVWRERRR